MEEEVLLERLYLAEEMEEVEEEEEEDEGEFL